MFVENVYARYKKAKEEYEKEGFYDNSVARSAYETAKYLLFLTILFMSVLFYPVAIYFAVQMKLKPATTTLLVISMFMPYIGFPVALLVIIKGLLKKQKQK